MSKDIIKIVIVDDHQIFLDGMISVLSKEKNIEILFVENSPGEALKKIKNQVPDLVISDISMPQMNGIEFIKILKNNYPMLKILVISMFKNIQSYHNIDGYLLKETDAVTLIKVINGIILNNEKYFIGEEEEKNDSFDFKKNILSPKEKEIIQLIAQEYTTEEIAEKLFTSKHTVEAHRKNIFLKLQVKNIAGLIKKAIYLGVIN